VAVVTVQLFAGRTIEQKRNLARAINEAMVEHVGARAETCHVIIQEIPKENWGRAGILASDRTE